MIKRITNKKRIKRNTAMILALLLLSQCVSCTRAAHSPNGEPEDISSISEVVTPETDNSAAENEPSDTSDISSDENTDSVSAEESGNDGTVTAEEADDAETSAEATTAEVSSAEDASAEDDTEISRTGKYSDFDLDDSVSASANYITLSGTSASGDGVEITDGCVKITAKGDYVFSGEYSGQIIVEASDDDNVHIILNGVTISATMAPIYVINAKNTVITLAEGTVNEISDTSNYTFETGEDEPDAVIFAKDDLTINGEGTLVVNGNYENGIKCKDKLKIVSGTITVDAKLHGISGKDCVMIRDGVIDVTSVEDAIRTTNDSDETKGFLVIDNGNITINAGDDALHAETLLAINNGNIAVNKSYESLEAKMIEVYGGFVNLMATDDALNAASGSSSTTGFNMMAGNTTVGEQQTTAAATDGTADESTDIPEMPDGTDMLNGMELPEGMEIPDGTDVPEIPEGMEMPDGTDVPEMPEGMEMPDGTDVPEMPEGMEMPDGTDVPEMPEGMEMPDGTDMQGGFDSGEAGGGMEKPDSAPEKPDGDMGGGDFGGDFGGGDFGGGNFGGGDNSAGDVIASGQQMNFVSNGNSFSVTTLGTTVTNTSLNFVTTATTRGGRGGGGFGGGGFGGGGGGGMMNEEPEEGVYILIAGGTIIASGGNDIVDSNGTITQTGGTLITIGSRMTMYGEPDGVLDANGDIKFEGGTYISLARSTGNGYDSIFSNPGFYVGNGGSGTISVADSEGNTIISFENTVKCNSLLISSESFKSGETYTVTVGENTYSYTCSDGFVKLG